jgi:hypothetical protein
MWATAPLISSGAALASGADIWATVRVFLGGFLPLLVLLSSFVNPKSYWKLGRFDFSCGVFSVLALLAWGAADAPRIAILFAIAADGFATIPTLLKAWRHPESETGTFFILSFLSVLIILPSIPEWNIENAAFQVYLLIATGLLMLAVHREVILERFKSSPPKKGRGLP